MSEEIVSLLEMEMEDIADAIISDPETGLAVEQRKRVVIGVVCCTGCGSRVAVV